jgi:hypothetical protein
MIDVFLVDNAILMGTAGMNLVDHQRDSARAAPKNNCRNSQEDRDGGENPFELVAKYALACVDSKQQQAKGYRQEEESEGQTVYTPVGHDEPVEKELLVLIQPVSHPGKNSYPNRHRDQRKGPVFPQR